MIRFPFEPQGINTRVSRLRPTVYPDLAQNPPRPTSNWLGNSAGPAGSSLNGLAGLGACATGELNPSALGTLYAEGSITQTQLVVWGVIATLGAGLGAYHGWKRTESYGWTVAWFLAGAWFPVITVPIAVAQGFGERKR